MEKKSIATLREIKEAKKAKKPIEIYRNIWGTHDTHGRRVVLTFGSNDSCFAKPEKTDKKDALGNHVWEDAVNKSSVLNEALVALCQEFTQENDGKIDLEKLSPEALKV